MIETFQKIEFCKKIHLFRGLAEEDVTAIAKELVEKTYKPGEVIVREGDEANHFYLIFKGRVGITRRTRKGQVKLAELMEMDGFGEDAILRQIRRTATVTAVEETTLLSLSRRQFHELISRVRGLRTKFEISSNSHKLARRKRFPWQEEGEVIYFINRKHPILLWKVLTGPVVGFLLPAFLLTMYLLNPSTRYLWAAGISAIIMLAWLYLAWLDWSNDYYIVTNRRVIYLEKVILIYDSRQEAPLTAILSVNTVSDVVGRTFGYGDVHIRTFVGTVVFRTIAHPEEVETLVRDYWDRTKDVTKKTNLDAMKNSIREKLGIIPPEPPATPTKMATKPGISFTRFKIRFEEKGIITYRKHWIVWLKQTWLPGSLLLICIALIIRDFFLHGFIRDNYATPEILIFLLIPLFLWWLYQTIDWSNDKFQVSSDQIFDIDRTPFGRVQKNVAPLDNILNMEARREGIFQVLFNYGNVYISTGGSQMVFEDVMNPDAVQQDIDQRRYARREKQDQERADAERERLAEFFATYHKNAEMFRREMDEHDQTKEKPPGPPEKAN